MGKISTAERLKSLMEARRMKQVDILNAAKPYCEKFHIKLEKNDLSQYVNGKVEPGQDKLSILGHALNVSEAWLMGFDVPMERETPTVDVNSERKSEYISLFELLTPAEQDLIVRQIKGILSGR